MIAAELDLLLAPVARFIRIAAGYTLSIYLLHFPIELMIAAILHNQPDGPLKTAGVITGAVALAVSIGVFIEPQRHWLKSFLWLWFARFSTTMLDLGTLPLLAPFRRRGIMARRDKTTGT